MKHSPKNAPRPTWVSLVLVLFAGLLYNTASLAEPYQNPYEYTAYAENSVHIQHTSLQSIHSAAYPVAHNPFVVPPVLQPYEPSYQAAPYPTQHRPRIRPQTRPTAAINHVQLRHTSRPVQSLSASRRSILAAAFSSLGVHYRWGGNSPRQGFDCSGLTRFAHKKVNITIPRTALKQSQASRTLQRRDLRPGDMIFFKTSGRVVNHVGIYIGNGQFIHAASGGGKVAIDDLRKNYWQKRLVKYGTFLHS